MRLECGLGISPDPRREAASPKPTAVECPAVRDRRGSRHSRMWIRYRRGSLAAMRSESNRFRQDAFADVGMNRTAFHHIDFSPQQVSDITHETREVEDCACLLKATDPNTRTLRQPCNTESQDPSRSVCHLKVEVYHSCRRLVFTEVSASAETARKSACATYWSRPRSATASSPASVSRSTSKPAARPLCSPASESSTTSGRDAPSSSAARR